MQTLCHVLSPSCKGLVVFVCHVEERRANTVPRGGAARTCQKQHSDLGGAPKVLNLKPRRVDEGICRWPAARSRAPRRLRDVDRNGPGCGEHHEGLHWAEQQSKGNDRPVLLGSHSRQCAARTRRIACDRCEGEAGSKSGVPWWENTPWQCALVQQVSSARSCVCGRGAGDGCHKRDVRGGACGA